MNPNSARTLATITIVVGPKLLYDQPWNGSTDKRSLRDSTDHLFWCFTCSVVHPNEMISTMDWQCVQAKIGQKNKNMAKGKPAKVLPDVSTHTITALPANSLQRVVFPRLPFFLSFEWEQLCVSTQIRRDSVPPRALI